MREIVFTNLEKYEVLSAIFSNKIRIQLKTQRTACKKSCLESLRNMRSSGAILSDNIGIQLKTQNLMREIGFTNLEKMRSSGAILSDNIGQLKTQETSCEKSGLKP